MSSLVENYENACMAYVREFEKKQELYFEVWVADRVGEVADFGCLSIQFSEIKHDIDNEIPKGKIIDYYDYLQEIWYEKKPFINYQSWLKL